MSAQENSEAGGARTARIRRETKETRIELQIDLDGGPVEVRTGVGFFDHMLEALACHGRLGLRVRAEGDLHVDAHHLVEDVGIALGTAIREALGGDLRIRRFASAYAPLDEALARAVMDVSGRGGLWFRAAFARSSVGEFPLELVEEFFRALAQNARVTLHLDLLQGTNAHHEAEALFKAAALALRSALERDLGAAGVPSTKGVLSEEAARTEGRGGTGRAGPDPARDEEAAPGGRRT